MPDALKRLIVNSVLIQAGKKNLAEESESEDGPKWVQVASAGEYRGYAGGEEPFTFDEKVFKQVINNLHAHPNFKAGANGYGTTRIVPWDFEHASTIMPSEGSLPVNGVPARAWTYDFEMRDGANGKELWALTEFLEPAKTYVKNGEYQWASVSLVFDAVDQLSGKNVGAIVMSIALTNTPFIEGMEKLVASKNAADAPKKLERWFPKAETPEDAISSMNNLFGFSVTGTAAELLAEIQKVSAWVASNTVPIGVDLRGIGQALRNILNLPALMPTLEVLQNAEQSLQAILAETSGAPQPAALANKPNTAKVCDISGQQGGEIMEFLKMLSDLLGTRETQEAVIAEVKEAIALRAAAKGRLNCAKDSNKDILEAVEDVVSSAASASEKLKALATALGVKDPDAAVARVSELMTQSAKLKELMPELETLREEKKKEEEKQVESDVEEAMASRSLGPEFKEALTLLRRSGVDKFEAQFPKQKKLPAEMANLLSNVTQPAPKQTVLSKVGIEGGQNVIDLASYSGANSTARAEAYVRANAVQLGVDPNSHEAVWRMAVDLKNNRISGPRFIDSLVAEAGR